MRIVGNILLLTAIVTGCNKSLDVGAYLSWAKQNPISATATSGDYIFTCTYKTPELMALYDLREEVFEVQADSVLSVIEDYASSAHFVLRFDTKKKQVPVLKHGISSQDEYGSRVHFLSVLFPSAITIIQESDTLQLANHHFERSYNMGSFEQVLFSLNEPLALNKPVEIVYNGLFTEKPLIFNFNSKSFSKTPSLKL